MVTKIRTKVNINVTDTDIDRIIETCIPDMKYWCDKIQYISSNPMHVYTGTINDEDTFSRILLHMEKGSKIMLHNKNTGQYYRLNRKCIIKGFKKFLKCQKMVWIIAKPEYGLYPYIPHINNTMAHDIIQYALFGNIIYFTRDRKME